MPRSRLNAFLLAALLATAMTAAGPLSAAELNESRVGEKLKQVERAIARGQERSNALGRRAKALGSEVDRARRERISTARSIQIQETAVARLGSELAGLNSAAREKRSLLKKRRAQSVSLLAALQRLALNPPSSVIAQPVGPADIVRGAILLRSTVPRIENQAARLKADLRALADTRRDISKRREQLEVANINLRAGRKRLDALLLVRGAERRAALAERKTEGDRLSKLARQATDLRDLFRRLELENRRAVAPKPAKPAKTKAGRGSERAKAFIPIPRRPPRAAGGRISKARGTLPYPASGRIVGRYGTANETGVSRRGIDLETLPGAQVIAPFAGRIVFAGKVRGYGQLLIIEHGEGYHTLLAGMSRIDGVLGQSLAAGEPVGIMGNPRNAKPVLYLELRRKGRPINPVPWLVAEKGKK